MTDKKPAKPKPVIHVLGCGARTEHPKTHAGMITCAGCGLQRPVAQFKAE